MGAELPPSPTVAGSLLRLVLAERGFVAFDQTARLARVPMAVATRPWTPAFIGDELPDGTPVLDGCTKRACNGCGVLLGDMTAAELNLMSLRRQLPDVSGDCPFCSRRSRG